MIVRGSDEQVKGGSKPLYTGVYSVKVKAFGSDLNTLTNELGFKDPKEQKTAVEQIDDSGTMFTRVRLDFWITGENEFLHKESFFVKNKQATSKAGNVQFTNAVSQFVYGVGSTEPTLDWFNKTGIRPAYDGEEAFMDFVKALVNHKAGKDGDELVFNWTNIFNGDFSELKKLVSLAKNNSFYVMLTVRTVDNGDGPKFYQSVYRKLYVRAYNNPHVEFAKKLQDAYGGTNDDYQGSTILKDYIPGVTAASDAASTSTEAVASSPWG